jgi:hypothetical protein
MTAALLYIFVFSTWGLGLLTWVVVMGMKVQKHNISIERKKTSLAKEKLSMLVGGMLPMPQQLMSRPDIHEKIKQYMKSSSGHPEVEEIDPDDVIVGIRFEGAEYPPEFDDQDEDE